MKGCIQTGLGKAFWETPVGTTRKEGHEVLRSIMASGKPYPRLEMAGQHPEAHGPDPGQMMTDPEYLRREYPFLEYWKHCAVVERNVKQVRSLHIDYPNSDGSDSIQGQGGKKAAAAGSSSSSSSSSNKASVIEIEAPTEPFRVELELLLDRHDPSSTAKVVVEVIPEWAPLGATQFKKLVVNGFYDNCRIFRVVPKFMSQFGISGTPGGGSKWKQAIKDDQQNVELTQGNIRGSITFAMSGKNSRTTQLFINSVNNNFLDKQGFTPFGRVLEGMEHWDAVNKQYGEKPNQGAAQKQGNKYLDAKFPLLTSIVKIRLM
jgi:cyclophilin family peptidyl-prolyl cis-trans isomerase